MGTLLLVRIGWRNLWRNPRGTLLTALAMGLGLALLLISLGLLDGNHEQMVGNAVRFGSGPCRHPAAGLSGHWSQELLLPAPIVSAAKAFLQTKAKTHGLRGVSPRLLASGLLSSAANADGVRIQGVIPNEERAVSLIPQRIVEGNYLTTTANRRCHWRGVGPQARGEDRRQSCAHDSGGATTRHRCGGSR